DPDAPGVQPIPTYDQDTVRGFAHVFTGWNFAGCNAGNYSSCAPGNPYNMPWISPMQAVEAMHDGTSTKQLLKYPGALPEDGLLVPPAGPPATAAAELDIALDNIFNHPNVGPFVARHLIQRLVTSNP